ncbi:MAG: ribosome biogenesis GTPase Der [Treponema sp.]|nr:ribosome biogenesis GTPase Der [Treponema sp.]
MSKKKIKPDFSKPKDEEQAEIQKPDKEAEYEGLPLVVIAGRPNVGKSTLFNRFLKKRVAITNDQPGVTRDPVEATAFLNDMPVHLVDTGGYKLTRDLGTKEAELDDYVVERSLDMIERCDVLILLLDAGEITGEDEEFIIKMRPYWKKLIAAVNKTEGGKNEAEAWNYARFGFDELIFISAEHGDRIGELTDLIVSKCDFSKVKMLDADRPVKIAILGKPNTGKSTLSNRLTHSENSIVCDYAGTTRDVVEGEFTYAGKNFRVLDTAGIRRKAKVHDDVEYYSVNRAIKTLDECDIVFLIIDAIEGLTEQDKKICSLAFEKGRGIIFVLNKWDLREEQGTKAVKAAREWMNIMFGQMDFAPIIPLSALEGKGIKDLLNTALALYEQLTKKIETSALNRALQDWIDRYPPPASKTAHFKIRYMTQAGTNPVSFIIFATKPEVVPEPYITYLKNRIREDLGFDQIPVQLELKGSRQKWEDR